MYKVICLFFSIGLIPNLVNAQHISTQLLMNDVLYQGLENPFYVSHPSIPCDELIVRISHPEYANLIKDSCGYYRIYLKLRNPKGLDVLIYHKKVKKRRLVSTHHYGTLKVSSNKVQLVGQQESTISIKALLNADSLIVFPEHPSLLDQDYKVSKFDYIYLPENDSTNIKGGQSGNQIPEILKNEFLKAQEKDIIIISSVYVENEKLGEYPLSGSLVLTVTK